MLKLKVNFLPEIITLSKEVICTCNKLLCIDIVDFPPWISAATDKPDLQSCAVAETEQFWWATGQSNLAYEWLAAGKVSNVWFSYSDNCSLANRAKEFDCPVTCQNCSVLASYLSHDYRSVLILLVVSYCTYTKCKR